MARPPSFPFYVSDYLVGTTALSSSERGCYIDCLCYQWEVGGIPADDPMVLARVMRVMPAEARRSWPAIAPKFEKRDDGLYYNARLEAEREKKEAWYQSRRENAKKPRPRRQIDSTSLASAEHTPSTSKVSGAAYASTPTPSPSVLKEQGTRAPRRGYADPFGFRRDFDAAAVVVVDESLRFSIPSKWADRVRGRYGLTEADIEAFAKALADHVKAAGEVGDGGNFLGWLDARLGAWRAGRDDEQQAAAMRQSARDFLDEQARVDATIPHRTPEQVRAILRPPKGGAA